MRFVKLPPFEKDLAKASTLPAVFYREPDVYALERERLFARTWQPVARVADVQRPGDYVTNEIAGEPIVVVRSDDGTLRAFFNVCRHRAGPPAQGSGNRRTLQCGYHGWTYDLRGALIGAPEIDGADGFDRKDFSLLPVEVATWGPFVFARLEPDGPPLRDWLGEMVDETSSLRLDEMRFVMRKEWIIGCNWKVYVDNYLEGYHVPVAHPRLYKELDYANYRVEPRRFHSLQHAPARSNPVSDASTWPSSVANTDRMYGGNDRALYYWVFPNWMVNIYPDNMSINIIVPLGLDRTMTIFEWYFHDAERPEVKARAEKVLAFSDEIQQEDIAICESVQKRLFSRAYRQGRFSVKRENGVHHFQGLLHEFLAGEP